MILERNENKNMPCARYKRETISCESSFAEQKKKPKKEKHNFFVCFIS